MSAYRGNVADLLSTLVEISTWSFH